MISLGASAVAPRVVSAQIASGVNMHAHPGLFHPRAQICVDAVHGLGKKRARDEARLLGVRGELAAALDNFLANPHHDPR